jgi:hypothetical protein
MALGQLTPMALAQILVGIAQQNKMTPLKTKFDPSPWTPFPCTSPQLISKKKSTQFNALIRLVATLGAHECLNRSIPKRKDRSVAGLLACCRLLFACVLRSRLSSCSQQVFAPWIAGRPRHSPLPYNSLSTI